MRKTPRRRVGGALMEMLKTALQPPVTKDYPFGPAVVAERFRGKLEIDPEKCTGCSLCQIVCPAFSVEMMMVGKRKVGDREIDVKRPIFDLYTCISCGLCVESCNFHALWLTRTFELATTDKKSLEMRKAVDSVK